MQKLFTLDGVSYDVLIPSGGLKRSFSVLDDDTTTRLMDGSIKRGIIGTYYNYDLQIDASNTTPEEYDALYEVLSAPVESHSVSFPYGQSVLNFKAYVSSGSDELFRVTKNQNYWQGLSVKFVASAPKRRPL